MDNVVLHPLTTPIPHNNKYRPGRRINPAVIIDKVIARLYCSLFQKIQEKTRGRARRTITTNKISTSKRIVVQDSGVVIVRLASAIRKKLKIKMAPACRVARAAPMLTRINQRIEVLLDAEHLIGHSYFMPLVYIEDESERQQALATLFKDKLVPLLQEYFFDDHQRIGWVFNDPRKQPEDRFIITDEALRDQLPTLQQLFSADIADQLMDRRYRLNETAFSRAEAYLGIVA